MKLSTMWWRLKTVNLECLIQLTLFCLLEAPPLALGFSLPEVHTCDGFPLAESVRNLVFSHGPLEELKTFFHMAQWIPYNQSCGLTYGGKHLPYYRIFSRLKKESTLIGKVSGHRLDHRMGYKESIHEVLGFSEGTGLSAT